MNITDVRVRKVAKEGKMKAVVSITIDDEFVVHDIKEHVTESRQLFWRNTRKSWTQSQKKKWLQNNW